VSSKPFYRRAWFWVWLFALLGAGWFIVAAMVDTYNYPCSIDYGTVVCAQSGFQHFTYVAIAGAIAAAISFFALGALLVVHILWRKTAKQIRADREAAQTRVMADDADDDLPVTGDDPDPDDMNTIR